MNDLRFAVRQLVKNPGFTLVAVLTLALGIGVNTSMFSALQVLLARPLPYPDPGSLVQVFQSSPGSPRGPHHSVPNFLDYQESGDFEYLAVLNDKPVNLAEPDEPAERVRGLQVSTSLFPLLGIQPALGRWFTVDEEQPGRNNVVILDYDFWQRRFLGRTNIIGRVLRLDGESVTVVGVMPARFHDIMLMGPVCLWRPIAFTESQRMERGNNFLRCIGRFKSGLSLGQAQAATDILAARQLREHPENSPESLRLVPLAEAALPPQARQIVWSIMALAGFVLLIACANLANLQFALRGNVSPEILRRAVADVDPDQPVGDPGPVRADIARSLDNWGVGGRLLSIFALLGLSLAALGIYGVISGFVVRRTGEIGVRMALGAQLGNVLWLVIGRGLRLTLLGTALGLIGAWGISRLLASVLPELPDSDPSVLGIVAVLLVAVTILACWLPARRAARIHPMEALRME